MIDAHIHVTAELLPYLKNIRCIPNADSPQEYAYLKSAGISLLSAGIHPWKADTTAWEEMEPILREVPVIGEIGLDSEWCSVDMDIQRQAFRKQLELAAQLGKPVILHTKGMEREILDTIRQYSNRYLVHWYDCDRWLEEYIDLGCWFTVGPELTNPNVAYLARTVPLDRLLTESDGLEGMAWGQGIALTPSDYPTALEEHLNRIAQLRDMEPSPLLSQMQQNLDNFING